MLYFKLGGAYMHLQLYDKASPMLSKAVELDPKFTMAELDLGKTLMRLGDVQRAATVLERLTARVPNLIDAHLLLEIVYARANRPETVSECEKVLKIIPEPVSYTHLRNLSDSRAISGEVRRLGGGSAEASRGGCAAARDTSAAFVSGRCLH